MTAPQVPGGVTITLDDIYRQLVALSTQVNASLARQDQADRILAEHEAALRPLSGADKQLVDHEARIRAMERSRWPVTSVTILFALASLAVAVTSLLLK